MLDISDIEFGDTTTSAGGSAAGGGGAGAHGGHGGSGNTGNTGNTGGSGNTGNTGNTGGSGNTGNTGGSGNTGNTGNTGGAGNIGNTGGSGGMTEDCGNGVDDTNDNLVDCEDPQCAGSHCIAPSAPGNWSGPVVYYAGGDGSVTCPPEWPTQVAVGGTAVNAAPPACTSCSCGSVTGASCAAPLHSFWTAADCSGAATTTQTPPQTGCVALSGAASLLVSARAATPAPSGGSCGAGGGLPNNSAPTFADHAVVCGGAQLGAGCSGSDVCAPNPWLGFEPTVCVWRDGGGSCNQIAPYSVKVSIYQGINDFRDCTNCTCGTPTNVTCSGTTLLYQDSTNSTCQGTGVQLTDNDSACANGTTFGSMEYQAGTATGGSCSPSSVSGTGNASGTDDITLCCLP